MFKQLRNKFLILNMSIISALMITAFCVIYFITYNNIQNENVKKLNTLSASPQKVDVSLSKMGEAVVSLNYSMSFYIQVDEQGKIQKVNSFIDMTDETYKKAAELAWQEKKNNSVVNVYGKKWMYKIMEQATMVRMGENGEMHFSTDGGQTWTVSDNYHRTNSYQIVFLDVTDKNDTLTSLLITFLSVGIVMLFVIFIISMYFANRAIKPISVSWDKQKQFIGDASHELKTPLAIISANYDALMTNKDKTIKSQEKWLEYIQNETTRMTKLVNELLYLANNDEAEIELQYSSFDISQTVNYVTLSIEAVAFEKGVTIIHHIEPDITIKSDVDKIKQVITILMDNAIKYTEQNSHIEIRLKKIKKRIIFSVKNRCIGLSKQDLSKLFDRFYRKDTARTYETGSHGLGLSIAKNIIEKLGGKIYAESDESDSITFIFML
ncbi:sensor histidine kinase [Lysinibacillus fusiformis]|uniref:sensor histidine kinase n=1 Tax=Lysinibacillus fusiformis TaxID=28031 RepID=UPI000D3C8747|nr:MULTISPECIES: HAMP domain-containing sensor histidine kinase [Lysinibacillus]MED4669730.1 HAMP domain-containing sensor histidine kinase [Lysinibacillus fusiformis]QAS55769.1 two-component sensor histidine kinase [Lysinibacillus sphaericus]RDV24952.1 two-component sensor histidine kinase [Lysinibacillus fusiformis]GED66105.1 histidine kinase [Lysinibacillus fusiformis]